MKRVLPYVSVAFNNTLLAAILMVSPVLTGTVFKAVGIEVGGIGIAEAQVTAKNKQFEKRKLASFGEATGKKVTEAYGLLQPEKGNPNPTKALQILSAIPKDKLNPYELSNVYQMMAYGYAQQEKYPQAIEHFNKVLAQSPNIAVAVEQTTYLTLGQLYQATENPKKALEVMLKWTDYVAEIKPEQYHLFASLYYQLDDKKNALLNINEAVKMVEASGKVAQEGWYGMQRSLHLEKEDYSAALVVSKKIASNYPKVNNIKLLAQLYSLLDKPKESLAMMEVTYLMGGLTNEKDLLNLAYMFVGEDAPYSAAKVVEKGIYVDKNIEASAKNLKFLAEAYRAARSTKKALSEYEKAAQKSTDGDLILGLAEMHLVNDNFKDASKWAKEALAKGTKRSDRANMAAGQAEFELKNYDSAINYFTRAAADERTSKQAKQWLVHTERQKTLAEQSR